ncbi:hypothetical protein SedNR2807_37770 [Citrobacter sedlakii]
MVSSSKVSRGKRAPKAWQIAEKGGNYTQNPQRCRDYSRFKKGRLEESEVKGAKRSGRSR